ncbi:flagellar basal body P-ring protein FlgI [Chthonobacter rhizosphaerae]|uniref:flagellar basal body P-ring protein FlgI n=1 Tax=Chthonobacter rhizosphaerae TaxID=2735553 RepID=UPI0015EF792B|nr:flagellar basal body P-ring protein FlgI [Chthonobacter rhizosphaerae]
MRALVALALLAALAGPAHAARIKDITQVQGVRSNQLVGFGLVVGLKGTGDGVRNIPFAEQALQSMLDRMGINIHDERLRTKNVAAVTVTADLPAFAGPGTRMDVSVSSIGDASSLQGGTLIATPLVGLDDQTYAIAQGPVAVGGFDIQGAAETLSQGVATNGRIANGGVVERAVPDRFADLPALSLELRNPDFVTAARIADAINGYTRRVYGAPAAIDRDLRTVALTLPRGVSPSRFMAEIELLQVDADVAARIVIDERTGTVVIGSNVQVSPVAVTHGALTVRVTDRPVVSQPAPFSGGETAVVPRTEIDAYQEGGQIAIVQGTDLRTLVSGLNRIGLKPNGIIAILQAIKSAGALQAELVVQ